MQNKFSVTQNAVKRIKNLTKEDAQGSMLRISVEAGGCSGFKYKFDIVQDKATGDDLLIEQDGVLVVIDNISLNFLNGAKLDFVESLGESFFEIKNPNAASGCGCGNSFSV